MMNRSQATLLEEIRRLHVAMDCPYEHGLVQAVSTSMTDCNIRPTDIRKWYRDTLPHAPCNICSLSKISAPNTFKQPLTMERALCIDTFFVRHPKGNVPILLMLDSATCFATGKILDSNKALPIKRKLIDRLSDDDAKDIKFRKIIADPDKPTGAAIDTLKDIPQYAATGKSIVPTGTHVANVEQLISTIRRKIRIKYAKFLHNIGIPMPIQFEPQMAINALDKLMHITSTATEFTSTPSVLSESGKAYYPTIINIDSGDIIIGFKQGDTKGQYAVVLNHTFGKYPIITAAYNLETNNESSGQTIYASFRKANLAELPDYIKEKLKTLSTEGRRNYKITNQRASNTIKRLEEKLKDSTIDSNVRTDIQNQLREATQPCAAIEDNDIIDEEPAEEVFTRAETIIDTIIPTPITPSPPNSTPTPPTATSSNVPRKFQPTNTIIGPATRSRTGATLAKAKAQANSFYVHMVLQDIAHVQSEACSIYHTSITKAIQDHPNEKHLIDKSVVDEWKQLLQKTESMKKAVLKVMDKNFSKQGKRVIPSIGFMKRKINKVTKGLDKYKYRVAAGGHRQPEDEYPKADISSPTLDHSSLLLFLSTMMKADGTQFATADFPGAYLSTDIDEEIYLTIDKKNVDIIASYPEFQEIRKYIRHDNTVLTKIQKGIYGLKQSGKLWYDKLKSLLHDYGCIPLDSNPCIFSKTMEDGSKFYIAVYVDDLMIATNNLVERAKFMSYINQQFPDMELNTDLKLSFLGMAIQFDYTNKIIRYDNIQYIEALCEKYNITSGSRYPYDRNFLNESDNPEPIDSKMYKSLIMSLFYIGKRTRSDILFPVSFLATKSQAPTKTDYNKAVIILKYLYSSKDLQLTHTCNTSSSLTAFIDASYALHDDAKSHTGSLIYSGRNLVHGSANKQKVMAKSSTESETNGVHSEYNTIENLRALYIELTGDNSPVIIKQDNMSAIHLMTKGTSISNKSKHMKVRYYYLKEKVDEQKISIEYEPTETMIADLLTKPLYGIRFEQLRNLLFNAVEDDSNCCFLFYM